ncbi:uncharacterized protein M6G45_012934 isoform 2-T2 [Spheniscus humboldti]
MQQMHHPHHLQPRRQLAAIDAHHWQPQPRPGQVRCQAQGSSLGNIPKRCWLRHHCGAISPRHVPSPPLQGCKSKWVSEHVRLSRASLAPRSRAAMAAARVAAILGLAVLLPTAAFPCGAPHPQHPDNATASKLLGTWLYVAGAAQFPRHLLEMLLIDHGHLHVEPRAGEQELLITQRVAIPKPECEHSPPGRVRAPCQVPGAEQRGDGVRAVENGAVSSERNRKREQPTHGARGCSHSITSSGRWRAGVLKRSEAGLAKRH